MADSGDHDVFDAGPGIRFLLDHDSFPQAGRMLRDHPELLSGAGERVLDALTARSGAGDLGYPAAAVAQMRAFLERCRHSELDTVFPHARVEIDPEIVELVRPDMAEAEAAEASFARTGRTAELTVAAEAWRRIVRELRLASAYPGLVAALLNNAGGLLLRRYWELGEDSDLPEAQDLFQRAAALTPRRSAHRAYRLGNLAIVFREVHQRTGDPTALDRAVELLREAVAGADGDPGSSAAGEVLTNLALVLRDRYLRTDDAEDLAEAVRASERACRESGTVSARVMLGDLLEQRYRVSGFLDDLTRAVDLLTEAVDETAPGSPDRPRRLVDLAITLLARHSALGDPADLDRAVQACEEAVAAMPATSPDRPACIVERAVALFRRYESTGLLDDLDRAAAGLEEAVATARRDEFGLPGWRVNLATILQRRWRRTGEGADLDRAVVLYESAAAAESLASDRFAVVNNLGNALRERARRTGATTDLDRAVVMLRTALTIATDGTPHHATTLANLGVALRDRHAAGAAVADLDEALVFLRRAVACTADGDPDGPRRLFLLAAAARDRSDLEQGSRPDPVHRDTAVDAYRRGCADGILVDPESTLIATLEWGGWATARGAWPEAADAYDTAIAASASLIERQIVRTHQEEWLRDVTELSARAAYTAAAAGRPVAAVVAVERTRAALLSQFLGRDRADLERLAHDEPRLAARYTRAAGRLRVAGSTGGALLVP